LKVKNENARNFYMIESVENNWASRELDRQISSKLFERIALSKDEAGMKELALKGQVIRKPSDIMKEPMVFEFLGQKENNLYAERELESALMSKLQMFLLELGKGFSFVARQKRITIDGDNFFIDLVFYNYILKCFVLIDLKMGKLTHTDIGQMDFYVRYFEKEMKLEGDNPTIGLLLCADKNDAMVKYTLLDESKNIFASKYKFYFPTEEELVEELEREKSTLEIEYKLEEDKKEI
jgi:predicted nuclease of restriction endonuclease-like (RecB) superfamily